MNVARSAQVGQLGGAGCVGGEVDDELLLVAAAVGAAMFIPTASAAAAALAGPAGPGAVGHPRPGGKQ